MLLIKDIKDFEYKKDYTSWKLFNPGKRYKRLKFFIIIAFSLVGAALIFYLIFTQQLEFNRYLASVCIILTIILTVVIHEIIHILFHPKRFFPENTVFILNIPKFKIASFYDDIMNKRRLIMILISPLVIISLLILIAAVFLKSADILFFMQISLLINFIASSNDVTNAIYILIGYSRNTLFYADRYYKIQADGKRLKGGE